LVGVFSLYSSAKDAFTEEHLRIFEVIAGQVSTALYEIASGEKQYLQQPTDSTLTLLDVVRFTQFLKNHTARNSDHLLYTIVITASHRTQTPEGTLALAGAVRRNIRSDDVLFRLGDSTLAVVLLNTDRHTAETLKLQVEANLGDIRSRFGIEATVLLRALTDAESIADLVVTARGGTLNIDGSDAIH
jgi:hypothetical protein